MAVLRFANIALKARVLQGADFFSKEKDGKLKKLKANGFRTEGRGPTYNTFEDWIRGVPATEYSVKELASNLREYVEGCDNATVKHLSDETSLHDCLLALGRSDEQAESEEFTVWFEQNGWLSDFTFPSRNKAEDAFNEFGGTYLIERIGNSLEKSRSERLALAMRCIAPICFRGKEKNRFAIACSLAVPSRSGKFNYMYRGCFSNVYRIPHWIFFQENSQTRDVIVFLAESTRIAVKNRIKGELITTSAGPYFKPSSHRIEMWKKGEIESYQHTEEFLASIKRATSELANPLKKLNLKTASA